MLPTDRCRQDFLLHRRHSGYNRARIKSPTWYHTFHRGPTPMPPQELPHEPPVGGSQSPLVDPQRQRTSRYAPYHRGDRTLSQRHRPGPLEQLPGNAYPRLLPRPTTDMSVATAPYNREVLAQITASLRESIPSIDPLTPAYEVNLSFIALCNTNLIHLTDDTVRREVEMRLLAASGKELVELARAVQLGIRDREFY